MRLKRSFAGRRRIISIPSCSSTTSDSENRADYLPGFPMHPHRGIETVTYLLAGEVSTGTAWATRAPSARATCSG